MSNSLKTPWIVSWQAPLSKEFSSQEYWIGLPCPPPGDLPNPGIQLGSPELQANSLPTELSGKWFDYPGCRVPHFQSMVSDSGAGRCRDSHSKHVASHHWSVALLVCQVEPLPPALLPPAPLPPAPLPDLGQVRCVPLTR